QRAWVQSHFPNLPIAEATHTPVELVGLADPRDLESLSQQPVAVLSGIARPQAFRRTVEGLNATIIAEKVFPDHHPYSRADIELLRIWAGALPVGTVILTTQKDFVKLQCPEFGGRSLYALKIQWELRSGAKEFWARIDTAAGECDAE
ncbi:MAG: tetraacyldisaccharide 4'-kinase, partial [Gemmataceae bacterium]